jgi:hypothetical protein
LEAYICPLATLKSNNSQVDYLLKDTAETESQVAEKSSFDQANRGEKLGLVWRNRRKISQIINDYLDYLYLPFFLLIILWFTVTSQPLESKLQRRPEMEFINNLWGLGTEKE